MAHVRYKQRFQSPSDRGGSAAVMCRDMVAMCGLCFNPLLIGAAALPTTKGLCPSLNFKFQSPSDRGGSAAGLKAEITATRAATVSIPF